jgi:hypothetical protein
MKRSESSREGERGEKEREVDEEVTEMNNHVREKNFF